MEKQEVRETCSHRGTMRLSIGSIIKQCLCYHDLNQSKTVVQVKQHEIFRCYQISYIAVNAQLGDFLYSRRRT